MEKALKHRPVQGELIYKHKANNIEVYKNKDKKIIMLPVEKHR